MIFRIRIRILLKISCATGSGSTTLLRTLNSNRKLYIEICNFKKYTEERLMTLPTPIPNLRQNSSGWAVPLIGDDWADLTCLV
jgi:hypothetical protein